MSIQEIRQNIIYENINKLIKSITPFQESDENFDLCEKFAISLIRNHRYLTVNSHEIKRRLEGLSERFTVANNQKYSNQLKDMCQQLITNPICMEHYERDIHWSILNFLLELSYNPVNSIKRQSTTTTTIVVKKQINKPINTDDCVEQNQLESIEREQLIKLLQEDNLIKDVDRSMDLQNENYSSSDLSNWSSSDEDQDQNQNDDDDELNGPTADKNQHNNEFLSIKDMLNTDDDDDDDQDNDQEDDDEESIRKNYKLKPPVKLQQYKLFSNKQSTSQKWLNDTVQTNWWRRQQTGKNFNCEINSNHMGANFCHKWNNKLLTLTTTTATANVAASKQSIPKISTISEYCLIREIIWMFNNNKMINCKFFHTNEINEEIQLNENVSIPSVTLNGIKSYLKHFTLYMTIVYRLKKFYDNVHNQNKMKITSVDVNQMQTGSGYSQPSQPSPPPPPPHSYECYANGLIQLLNPMHYYLMDKERELIDCNENNNQNEKEIDLTIIRLYNEMNGYFQILDRLYDIHKYSVLDFTKNYSHICTAHLMAGLLIKTKTTAAVQHSNLAGALFLYTCKIYLQIIDIWWTDGRLEDWRNEFLIDKDYDDQEHDGDGKLKYKLRLIHKCKEQSFYVSPVISQLIDGNKFIRLLKEHSIKAGYALNILLAFDRIHELKLSYINQENLYKTFISEFFKDLLQLTGGSIEVHSNNSCCSSQQNQNITDDDDDDGMTEFHKSLIKFNDNILSMAFEKRSSFKGNDHVDQPDTEQLNAYNLYERLNKSSIQILPFEQMIMKILSILLESRTSVANNFVIKMFKDEYRILQHLQNLRKVFLMEAGDLMYYFYSNLFQQIESDAGNWANPYLLTIQLNGILCSKYPDMSSLFNIEILSGSCSKYALEAIDGIKLNYLINENLSNIINESHLKQYNEVFRFLLKIKWGQWSLENLRFPRKWKRRLPYRELTLDDVILKRLALVRNWILYSIQSIHSHLMTLILQTMGQQLDERIGRSMNLLEIISIHNSYINTIYNHCFQCVNGKSAIRIGIEQLLNLIMVVQIEWDLLCTHQYQYGNDGMADITDGGTAGDCSLASTTTATAHELSIYSSQIEEIESTYINCHCYLAGLLNAEVYSKNQTHLSGLSAAFNCSCPY